MLDHRRVLPLCEFLEPFGIARSPLSAHEDVDMLTEAQLVGGYLDGLTRVDHSENDMIFVDDFDALIEIVVGECDFQPRRGIEHAIGIIQVEIGPHDGLIVEVDAVAFVAQHVSARHDGFFGQIFRRLRADDVEHVHRYAIGGKGRAAYQRIAIGGDPGTGILRQSQ